MHFGEYYDILILESNMSNFLRRLRSAAPRLAGLFQKSRRDRDLSEEIASHLEMHIDDNLRSGMSPVEARRDALIKLGGVEQAKEIYRDRRGVPMIETTLQDLRYGLRTLRHSPGFTFVAVTTLALGIAVNTTIFSVVNAILLRKPPISDPDRVMVVSSSDKLKPGSHFDVTVPDYIAWREQSQAFDAMAAALFRDFTLTGGTEPRRAGGLSVTADYFRVLNVSAALGRTFLSDEDQSGHEHVILLSNRLWQAQFNSDPAIVGKTAQVNGERYTVIGVMPAKFRLSLFDAELWTPLVFTGKQLAAQAESVLSVAARLKPGAPPQQAQAEMTAIAQRLEERYAANKNRSALVLPLQEFMIVDANVRPALLLLMGSVVFVLLIACTNVANLLLARNAVRQRELVIRAAVGAGRTRLVRQLLVESLLIGAIGGTFGMLLAVAGTELLRSQLNWNDYVRIMASEITLDRPVLVFCLLLSLGAAIVFGLLPALQASKLDLNRVLNEGARGGSGGINRRRLRSTLVVGEIALSIILLAGAGIMIQNAWASAQQSLGFEGRNLLTAELRLAGARYEQPPQQAAFFRNVLTAARSLPGVERASVTSALPATGSASSVGFQIEGRPDLPKDSSAFGYVVGPDYFQTMRIPIFRGRGFAMSDDNNSPGIVVVNQTFVQRFFGSQDPIGRRIVIDSLERRQIVGVVGAVRNYYGEVSFRPQIYESFLQKPQAGMALVLETKSDPLALTSELRQAIWSVDRDQPIAAIESMRRVLADNATGDSFMGWLMGCFAALALLLAGVGIFGVIAYNVAQRTREMGIRMALGAGKGEVLRLVVGQSAWLAGLGIALGMLGAFPLPGLMAGMFNGLLVSAGPVLTIVPLVVAAVSLAASYIPAQRATRVEPMTALRSE